jgi:parallel beta-helix repeat protein
MILFALLISLVQGQVFNPQTLPSSPWGRLWILNANDAAGLTDLGVSAWMQTWIGVPDAPHFRPYCLLPEINVMDHPYHATGDGATDDTAAIQAAENAADASGGTLYFPPGAYVVTATVIFDGPVSLRGSPGSAIVELAASLVDDPLFRYSATSGFTIQGMTFTGAQTQAAFAGAPGEDRAAIELNNCSNFSVRDITVTAKTMGVWIDNGSSKGIVSDSRFIGFADPADYAAGSGYNYCKAVGIGYVSAASDIVVQGCSMEHWGDGVSVSTGSSRVTIAHNHIEGICDNGVYASSASDCTVEANTMRNTLGYGIKMRGSGHKIIGNAISDCGSKALNIGGGGINVTTLSTTGYEYGLTIADNTIQTTTSFGIRVNPNTTGDPGLLGWSIVNNDMNDVGDRTVVDDNGMGINLGIGISSGIVAGNHIRLDSASSTKGSFAIMGAAATISHDIIVADNLFRDVNETAIFTQYASDISYINNRFEEVKQYCFRWITATPVDRCIVSGNQAYNGTAAGTVMMYAQSATALTNSRIFNNAAAGNFTSVTNASLDAGTGNWVMFNDSADKWQLKGLTATATWDPASLADGAGETRSVTVTGAALGDFAIVAAPYDLSHCTVTAFVQAANTVFIRLQNESTGVVDLASGTWRVTVLGP